ncbi:hypothetical protein ScPMuIL_015665 [Solemya velum]
MSSAATLLTATIIVTYITSTSGDENEYRLVRDLMGSYDPRPRPVVHHSQALNVTFSVALAQIIDVDERNQIITTNCWLNQNWLDYKLVWDPRKFGNITNIRLPYDEVWKPDILLYNNADVSSSLSAVSTNVIVTNGGNVTWLSMWIFKSSCSIDVKYFPFDVQNCSLDFASWTYESFEVNLVKNADTGDTSNYVDSSEWELLNFQQKRQLVEFSCCPDNPYVFINYFIVIKRRPLFYIFNMMMPCVLITLVALLGFYMPSDSGEKISMGITTLLSMTVFLMIVAESMPPTSDVVPLIGMYYGITIAIVSSATGMTVLTLNIHHKGTRGHGVPPLLKRICFGVFAKFLFIKLDLPEPPEHGLHRIPQTETHRFDTDILTRNGGISPRFARKIRPLGGSPCSDNAEQQFTKLLQKVQQTIERNEFRLAEQDRRDHVKKEWQQLALVLDRLLLLCFLIVTVSITLSLMVPPDHSNG